MITPERKRYLGLLKKRLLDTIGVPMITEGKSYSEICNYWSFKRIEELFIFIERIQNEKKI